MRESQRVFRERLPKPSDFTDSLLIYDRRLAKRWGSWIRRFPRSYAVTSGEDLKDLRRFPAHVEKILKKTEGLSPAKLTIVAFGGGSVGDFAGFLASVFKRGVDLVQIPSTWLAAIDSAHGGKTALNAGRAKNQVGTFYPARQVILVREVLLDLGRDRFLDAWPEAVKVALLSGTKDLVPLLNSQTPRGLWDLLPRLIEAKLRIVRRDPLEKKGIRHLLNFGHTVGHLIEAETGMSHGLAIGYGLSFAMVWSEKREGLRAEEWIEACGLPSGRQLAKVLGRLKQARSLISQDKKIFSTGRVRFVFLRAPGRPLIESVGIDEIVGEIRRQGAL